MSVEPTQRPIVVRGTEILPNDSRQSYREKIARITLDSMVQFVGLLDANGTVLEINKVALDAVGIELADVEGKPFWTTFWWQVSEEVNATLRESIARAANGEFVRWDTEIYGRSGGKETIIIDASLMPVFDDAGKVVYICAEGRDITEKKAHEREIARQREELAKLDELKTRFFANISHEFRTPLTLMMGPLEDALSQSEGLSTANRERLELTHRNSLRLLKLVNTLLDFSRIEAGRIQASYEPTDLSALTVELASVFRSAVERDGMRLTVDCPPLPEKVYVDREMWEKVVLNLLSNAFKFTLEGEIEVSLRPVDSAVQLTVRDTGTGIPVEEIPRLFERFHRVKGARGRSYEGSGIGLALVHELVKLHGGTVGVESEVDRGSQFTVTIPLGKAHLPADRIEAARTLESTGLRSAAFIEEVLRWLPEVRREEPIQPGKIHSADSRPNRQRILLADDNADMREYVRRLLGGYEVEAVADGRAALRAALERKFDLVLTDVMMPVMDGFELLRELRANPLTREMPVILLSARAGEESRIEGLEAGADDYLTKPFSGKELLARVQSHLQLAEFRRESREALRRAEEMARESGERFRLVARASNDAVWDWDLRTNRVWWNEGVTTLFGYRPDEVGEELGWWYEHIHPDDRDRVVSGIQAVIDSGGSQWAAEYRFRKADGHYAHISDRGYAIHDDGGRTVRMLGGMQDVTARKHSEEALAHVTEESERRRRLYETILSGTPDLVYVFALDHRFTYANEALLTMWGKTWDEAIGKTCLELGYPDWHASKHDREIEQVIATKKPIRDEVPFTGTNGRRIYDYIFVPVFGTGGEVEAVAGTTRDITERKAMEEELRGADRRKDEFIALLAHELRNPLAPIRNGLSVLRLAGNDPEALSQARSMMDRQLSHMVRLIDDLLDVSRISRNKMELRRARVALTEVVSSAVETAKPLIDEARHVLDVSLPSQPVYLDADLTRLAQVFSNLLTNSARYTPPGGRIRISAERGNGTVLVSIRDNGIGIPSDSLDNIFDMFSQVDRTIERTTGGLGIGLALVKGLVEMHGGSVTVASEGEGKGSTFTVTLPTLAGRAETSAPQERIRKGPSRRILVVDDTRDSADSLAMMLRLLGNEVRTANDGVAAVELAETFRPEVILMDVGMPRMNGMEATRRIREHAWGEAITIIALTGYGQDGDRERSREAGCDGHLVKPVNLPDLERMLAEARKG